MPNNKKKLNQLNYLFTKNNKSDEFNKNNVFVFLIFMRKNKLLGYLK